jgi:hypothetical protein
VRRARLTMGAATGRAARSLALELAWVSSVRMPAKRELVRVIRRAPAAPSGGRTAGGELGLRVAESAAAAASSQPIGQR